MKATVETMKLEVIVRGEGEVLCHEVVEKNKSSSKKLQKSKKIQVEMGDINDKKTEDKSKHKSNSKKVKKATKIRESNENGDQNNKNTDDKSKEETKDKSLFSKLMCCCRKKKTKETNQEILAASENVAASSVENEPPLPLENAENAVDHSGVAPFNVPENGELDNNFGDSLTDQPEMHLEVPTSASSKSDEKLDHVEVIPLKSSDTINHSDDATADIIDPVEPLAKNDPDKLLLLSKEAKHESNHMNVIPRNHSNTEPSDTIASNEQSAQTYSSESTISESALSESTLSLDEASEESNQMIATPLKELSDNESAENNGGYLACLQFEAQIWLNTN